MIRFRLNGKPVEVDAPAETPALWVIREDFALTGTKFGCGVALCGACTIHVNGSTVRSCVTPIRELENQDVLTIEGLGANELHAVQKAWIAESVPQCGYCQSGQILAAVSLLRKKPKPTDDEIDHVMAASLCRCGTYQRVRAAIHRVAGSQ